MTLLLIAFIIVAVLLIVSSLLWFFKREQVERIVPREESPYQKHMESLRLMLENGSDRDKYWHLTTEFVSVVYKLHVLTWRGAAIQRRSIALRIRHYGYMAAIN